MMYKVLPAVLIVQHRVCSQLNTLVQKDKMLNAANYGKEKKIDKPRHFS